MADHRTLNEAIITEIRVALARRDITHLDFARMCGWEPMYLSRRMTGQVPWSADDIDKVARKLDLSVLHLNGGEQ